MDKIHGFAEQFRGMPLRRREERAKKERRAQLTEKQRHPGHKRAVRTTQMGFRCAPEFHQFTKQLAAHMDCSVSDVVEEAVYLLAKNKKFKGGADG